VGGAGTGYGCVTIPISVAPLIRVFHPLVFAQIFPWRQVFQWIGVGGNGLARPCERLALRPSRIPRDT